MRFKHRFGVALPQKTTTGCHAFGVAAGVSGASEEVRLPLFSRRALQSLIAEAAEVIPLEKRRWYANSFNEPVDFQAVAAEWELAMYRPLRALGEVVHEPPLGGSSAVDYLLASKDRREAVAIEVTCVSAKAEEEANPIEAFQRELQRRLRKVGRTGSGWKLNLGTRDDESQPRSQMIYAIPPRSGLTTSATGKGHTLAPEKSSEFARLRDKYKQLRSSEACGLKPTSAVGIG